jgi:hypothetical protein
MVVWRLEDDCLAPTAKIKIEFKGKNPFSAYKTAKDFFKTVFGVGGSKIFERDFRWDITSDPRYFFIRYFVKKPIDMRSYVLTEVIFEGHQPSNPEKEGDVTITINGRLITEYERKTAFQKLPLYKALIWIYNFIFYNKVRRNYLKLCQDWLYKLEREFKTLLSMP